MPACCSHEHGHPRTEILGLQGACRARGWELQGRSERRAVPVGPLGHRCPQPEGEKSEGGGQSLRRKLAAFPAALPSGGSQVPQSEGQW